MQDKQQVRILRQRQVQKLYGFRHLLLHMERSLMKQMAEKQGVTEQVKIQDQMKWVGLMNGIKACAEEIVLKERVYM